MTGIERPAQHYITTGGTTYRIAEGIADVDAMIEYMITDKVISSGPFQALSRQQVLARIGRSALPTNFPPEDVVIGDPDRDSGGYIRGWLESTVTAYQDQELAAVNTEPAAESPSTGTAEDAAAETEAVQVEATPEPPQAANWPPKSRQWTDVSQAIDQRIAIVTSRGIVMPSGVVLAGPLPDAASLEKFVRWRWDTKPKDLPQVWVTYEALVALGVPIAYEDGVDLRAFVRKTFDCEVSWGQSGWFTCKFAAAGREQRTVHLVLMPFLFTDPATQRPGDMGLAGWQGTQTELPDDETEAVHLLAERMAWLAEMGGKTPLAPAARWATVGANLLDDIRNRGRAKPIEPCPLPTQVAVESGGQLEPAVPPKWDHAPHRALGDRIVAKVDQRAAYLASAGQIELGYGTPKEVHKINVDIFNESATPFGLWRITVQAGQDIDGMTKRLPLPHPAMRWEEATKFWITTRGIKHLIAPVEVGGAGLSVPELEIDAAWVWPEQGRLLRTWADVLRVKLKEAREQDRRDHEEIIKGIYTAYLGRAGSDKWMPSQRHHQQPAWYAAIRADTRWRAHRYARMILNNHNLYPVSAELDAWHYWLPAGTDPAILTEPSADNGKYRVTWTSVQAADGTEVLVQSAGSTEASEDRS